MSATKLSDPELSAWKVRGAAARPPADRVTWGLGVLHGDASDHGLDLGNCRPSMLSAGAMPVNRAFLSVAPGRSQVKYQVPTCSLL